jgi:hypothetical protein
MKGLIIIIIFTLLVSCYGNDDDPGSTPFCKTIGKARKDEGCKRNPSIIESSIINQLAGNVFRCADPKAVKDLVGNCFNGETSTLFRKIEVANSTMTSNPFESKIIMKSEAISIGSICNEGGNQLTSEGTLEQSIFEYDPKTRSAIRVLRKQDPRLSENAEFIKNRDRSLNRHLVSLQVDTAIEALWIVTFSGLIGYCYPQTLPASSTVNNYFQILEVKN